MQTQTDPYASQAESLATTGAAEIERLRFILQRVFGVAQWYRHDQNVNFGGIGITRTNVQGSGSGAHVTAVGLHTWSGGSERFPKLASTDFHTTGIWWPRGGQQTRWTVSHHLAVSIDPGVERDKGGVEVFRLHFSALTLHHTVALRWTHSRAFAADWQYPHVTALQIRAPQRGASGSLPTPDLPPDNIADQIIVGHRGVALQLQGASLIPAANRLVGFGATAENVEGKAISGTLTITHQAGQIVFGSSQIGLWASRGQFSGYNGGTSNAGQVPAGTPETVGSGHVFTLQAHLVTLMDASSHALTIQMAPAAVSVNISDDISANVGGPGSGGQTHGASPNGRDRRATFNTDRFVHFYWIWHTTGSLLRGLASPCAPAGGSTVTTGGGEEGCGGGPNLPLGFSSWAYAGAVRLGSITFTSTPMVGMHLLGSLAYYHVGQLALSNGTATTETTVDLSAYVPPNAVSTLMTLNDAGGRRLTIRLFSTGSINLIDKRITGGSASEAPWPWTGEIPNVSRRFFYLYDVAPTPGLYADVQGYRLPNGGG